MPVGEIAQHTFTLVTSIVTWVATAKLRPVLQGRQPCRRWFAFLVATLAATTVFVVWIGNWGLGAAEPGLGGAAFGLLAGLIWGGFFASVNTFLL